MFEVAMLPRLVVGSDKYLRQAGNSGNWVCGLCLSVVQPQGKAFLHCAQCLMETTYATTVGIIAMSLQTDTYALLAAWHSPQQPE